MFYWELLKLWRSNTNLEKEGSNLSYYPRSRWTQELKIDQSVGPTMAFCLNGRKN